MIDWSRFFAAASVIVLVAGCGSELPAPADDQRPASGQLRLGAVLGDTDLSGFSRADRPRRFQFPDDHGAHPSFRSEWWYLTLVLSDAEGADIGVQFTLFRQALTPDPAASGNRWRSNQVYLAHLALVDVASGQHLAQERFARGHPALAGVQADPFALWLEDWRLDAREDHWRLSAGTARMAIDVALGNSVAPVLQGDRGFSRKGPDQASYYYSMPRLPVNGRVMLDGQFREVTGFGWLDREWSTSVLSNEQVGWDWLALQLDDGRSIMAYQLRRQDGRRDAHDQGIVVAEDGSSRRLAAADFTLTPTRIWEDEEGVGWPVAWAVNLGDEVWRVEAVLDDQLMKTTIRYWEGMVSVLDESGQRIGRGYLELTGYQD